MDDHTQRVRDLTDLVYGAGVLQAGARDDLELDSFLGSLGSGRLRAHLAAMQPTNLADAVAGAKEFLVCFPPIREVPQRPAVSIARTPRSLW